MKKIFLTLLTLLTTATLWAQAPQRMSYQSVIRDGSNVIVASTPVGIKISLLQGSATGTAVYVETHRKATNANGLLSLEIGDGTALTGTFAGIDWANGPYLIKTETDPTGGTNYSIPGIAALNSVPYALFSANGTPGPKGDKGETGDSGAIGPTGATGSAGAIGPQGIQGPPGVAGANGLSAYQVWLGLGNTGTEANFIASLTGPAGPQGPAGVAGTTGPAGADGAAASAATFVDLSTNQTIGGTKIFTGTVSGVTSAMVGLGNVDNTSDADKPVSTATTTALGLKAPIANPTFTGIPAAPTATSGTNTTQIATTEFVTGAITTANSTNANLMGPVTSVGNATAIADAALSIAMTNGLQTALNSKAPLASPTFTGTVSGVTSAMVGLGNVDNTSDTDKPVSTATTTALGLKAPIANPTFTGDAKAETASAGDNDVSIATTAFVANAVSTATSGTFVDLTTNQTIAGAKNFSSDIAVQGLTIGKGGGSQSTVIGESANATQPNNTALGFMTLDGNSGTDNTAVGTNAMRNSGATSYTTAIGENAGTGVNAGSRNTYLGYNANVTSSSNISNATAIGSGALVTSSNTIQLGADGTNGTTAISNVKTSGTITAKRYELTAPTAISATSTTTIDLSSGNVLTVNLEANISTLTITNAVVGTYLIKFVQDGTGSRTVTFPTTNWKWSSATVPTITTTAGKTDIVTLIFDGTTYYAAISQNF